MNEINFAFIQKTDSATHPWALKQQKLKMVSNQLHASNTFEVHFTSKEEATSIALSTTHPLIPEDKGILAVLKIAGVSAILQLPAPKEFTTHPGKAPVCHGAHELPETAKMAAQEISERLSLSYLIPSKQPK